MLKLVRIVGLMLVVGGAPRLSGQISPGPLSAAHTKLEGATKCTSCHTLAMGAPKFKCLTCHTEIRERVQAKRGLHGKTVKLDGGGKQECVRCHTDHYGVKFNIVKWESSAEEFDHRQTGYPLVGKHAGRRCNECHTPQRIGAGERAKLSGKDLSRTYLGLTTACVGCHKDVHQGQLGNDCARCHSSPQAWKPVTAFQHSETRYPLTGQHERVACAKCHTGGDGVAVKYKGVAFGSCGDCHKDPHRGAFPGSCQSCHTTAGWKQVDATAHFNHSGTKFPLNGAHAEVGCFKCHKSSNFKEPVAHARCADCHREDPHTGQFVGGDCASCHTEKAFKPSTFDEARHQKSAYPLVGKHAAVQCAECHKPAGKATRYKVAYGRCLDCHKDAHGAQFEVAPVGNRCQECHTEHGFKPSTYTMARHGKTRFVLTGGHAATPCQACHKPDAGVFPAPPARYHFATLACTGCHVDPHPRTVGTGLAKQDCTDCHTTSSWLHKTTFDHSGTGYVLEGAHKAVACTGCHKAQVASAVKKTISFQGAGRECGACHEDIHGGQFKVSCKTCHQLVAWRPTVFDHEAGTRFSLVGAHKEVPCGGCHKQKPEVVGRRVLLYRETPRDCAACHDQLPAGR